MFLSIYDGMAKVPTVIIAISLMLFCGFAMTRLTKLLKLPNVTAYIVVGIIIGPYCLKLIPTEVVEGMDFISDIALAFISFGMGEFFRVNMLKQNGLKALIITITEALVSAILVFVMCFFVFKLSITFSLILASLASATAPTSTMMTIRQTGAKGDFVNTLIQVIAIDDIIALIFNSIAISVAKTGDSSISFISILKPLLINIGVLILGGVFGFVLKLLMPAKRTNDNRLIIIIALLFAFCGICALLDISPLLGCMSMGMVYINATNDEKLFKQLNYFSPPILLLFFVRSGFSLKLDALVANNGFSAIPLIVIALSYLVVRFVGKYFGCFAGACITKKSKSVRNYLGLGMIPQSSVAIGLAALGARALDPQTGDALNTIILASSILYEIIGPACAKLALYLSKSYTNNIDELVEVNAVNADGSKKNDVDLLIEKIQKIQEKIPKVEIDEDEEAFNDAINDQYESYNLRRHKIRKHIN